MIYVTVGTHHNDFARLIHAVNAFAQHTDETIVVQTGLSTTLPAHCDHFDFKPREECLELQRSARVIVCHAGIGAALDALHAKRPFIVVPRLKRHGEHNTDHQLELATAIEKRGWATVVRDMTALPEALANPTPPPENYWPARSPLIEGVQAFVQSAARRA